MMWAEMPVYVKVFRQIKELVNMKQYRISVISVPFLATLGFPKFIGAKFVYIATAVLKLWLS